MSRKRAKPYYENVRIEEIGAEGKSLARINDLVVFTTQVIPGDIVDLQTKKERAFRKPLLPKYIITPKTG